MARDGFGWAAMMRTGPNDAKHVVWALGTFLKIFILPFFVLTNIF